MPHPTDVHVGRKVRDARVAKWMSQTELGALLGVSFQQVQKYEKGTNRLGASRLWATAIALDLPVPYFFEGLEGGPKMSEVNQAELSRKAIATAAKLHKLSNDTLRRQIIGLIDSAYEAESGP
ncbi:helix-turn-helix transcriptional regulator [Marivibrio halodurans]|uniref:Helix-turn-helix transcriptional regulator n=1 Tax=Marivibrio halodurans TaxID=2039722 RepID=A0A8J7S101_9PROT|nr:helix-turn-helix transcriptional regulator [Marivibrio halodurans]MBP5856648.1 helix-turn-helix transcriptional regulator [Marivibrio halodurans]